MMSKSKASAKPILEWAKTVDISESSQQSGNSFNYIYIAGYKTKTTSALHAVSVVSSINNACPYP